jgi:hypothetical protein
VARAELRIAAQSARPNASLEPAVIRSLSRRRLPAVAVRLCLTPAAWASAPKLSTVAETVCLIGVAVVMYSPR